MVARVWLGVDARAKMMSKSILVDEARFWAGDLCSLAYERCVILSNPYFISRGQGRCDRAKGGVLDVKGTIEQVINVFMGQ